MDEQPILSRRVVHDPSFWLLIASNLITLAAAVYQGWDLRTLMFVYWAQSVIIGIFNFFRILSVQNFSTTGLLINGHTVEPTVGTKRYVAFFFAMHYGIFHLVYFFFIASGGTLFGLTKLDLSAIGLLVLMFFINHAFSFFYNWQKERTQFRHLGKMMFHPYARILPMHLTIIFGSTLFASTGSLGLVLALFLGLKTLADVIMHVFEHMSDRAYEQKQSEGEAKHRIAIGGALSSIRSFFGPKDPK